MGRSSSCVAIRFPVADQSSSWSSSGGRSALARGALAQVVVAVAAGFGRAISEVGASVMVGGNIVGQTRILTTAIALDSGRGEFALALALGFILILLALGINALLGGVAAASRIPLGGEVPTPRGRGPPPT